MKDADCHLFIAVDENFFKCITTRAGSNVLIKALNTCDLTTFMLFGSNSLAKLAVMPPVLCCGYVNDVIMRSSCSCMSSDDFPRRQFISGCIVFSFVHRAIQCVAEGAVFFLASSNLCFLASWSCFFVGACLSWRDLFAVILDGSGDFCDTGDIGNP